MIYKDDLERVYALIEKPENWTQGVYARDAGGEYVGNTNSLSETDALSPRAVCWCLAGAAIKARVIAADTAKGGSGKFGAALGLSKFVNIHEFNDTHTHAEVLALLRSAIERAPVRP